MYDEETVLAEGSGFQDGSAGSSQANDLCVDFIEDGADRCFYDCEYDGYGNSHSCEIKKNSRLKNLLFFFCLLFLFSCKKDFNKNNTKSILTDNFKIAYSKVDSITISVNFKKQGVTGFNIMEKYLKTFYLEFKSHTNKDTVISKKIPINYKNQVILYMGFDSIPKIHTHHYLIGKEVSILYFEDLDGDILLKSDNNNILVDNLFSIYKKVKKKIKSADGEKNKYLEKYLDSIYHFYKKKYSTESTLLLGQLNKLQMIYPLDVRVDQYIKEIKEPIVGAFSFRSLIGRYIKNRIHTFNFKKLILKNYSQEYIKWLEIGIFNFLRYEDNKGDKEYQVAIDWLKTTNLYKNDSVYVNKEITPLDNNKFKNHLKNLSVLDLSFKETSFSEIIKSHPSKYYFIDFWATWCKPCIEGINIMKKMKIPKNVAIISLSLDKTKVKNKWKIKTQKLYQKISYLVKEEDIKNKEFLKFIELQSIPRYILIDKNMNLIDEAFLHPHELNFLSRLKDIKYAKYW